VLAAAFQSFPKSLSRHVRLTGSLHGFTHALSVEQRVKIDAQRSKLMLSTLSKSLAEQGATIAAMAKQAERFAGSLKSLDGGGGGSGGGRQRKKPKKKWKWSDDGAYAESYAQAHSPSPGKPKGGKCDRGGKGGGKGKGGKGDRGGKGKGRATVTFATQKIAPATLVALQAAYPNDDEPILDEKRWEWLSTFKDKEASKDSCFFRDKLKLVCKNNKCPACN
jgi:hypothetical protein